MRSRLVAIALVASATACTRPSDGGEERNDVVAAPTVTASSAPPPAASSAPIWRELDFAPKRGGGFSGLARAGDDYATVSERDLLLMSFRLVDSPDGGATAVEILPDVGVAAAAAPGRDLESLAWLGPGRFAVGTEASPATATEVILYLRREGPAYALERRLELPRHFWPNLTPTDNAGVEGLCAAGGFLVAALEAVVGGAARSAPLAVRAVEDDEPFRPHTLRLTTDTGKVAGLSCVPREGRLEVTAIERHFGVARVLRFEIDPTSSSSEIEPRVVADLTTELDPLPNFEGVEDTGREILLLTDNDHRGRAGPTRLFAIRR